MNQDILDQVRAKTPLIHHLTNQVVMNFSANGLLSFGGTPAMAKYIEVVGDLAKASDGVLLNLGTLTREEVPAMIKAGKTANAKGIPVVLDPVGIAGSAFSREAGHEILKEVNIDCIKGNAGEMAFLAEIPWQTRGVDSVGSGDASEVAKKVAAKYETIALVTGEIDYIASSDELLENKTGHALLTKITGGGCLLGSIVTACLTTEGNAIEQVYTATAFYGLAAEYAANRAEVRGPGTLLPVFIDALSYDILDIEEELE